MKTIYLFFFAALFQIATSTLKEATSSNTLPITTITITIDSNTTKFFEPLFNDTRISAIKALTDAINNTIQANTSYSGLVEFLKYLTITNITGPDNLKAEILAIQSLANLTIAQAFLMSHLTSLNVFNQGLQVMLQTAADAESYYGINIDSDYLQHIKTLLAQVTVNDADNKEKFSGLMVIGSTGFLTIAKNSFIVGISDYLDSGVTIDDTIENIKNKDKVDPTYAIRQIFENEELNFDTMTVKIKALATLTTGVIFGLFGTNDYEGKLLYHKGSVITAAEQEIQLTETVKNLTVTNYQTATKIPSDDTRLTKLQSELNNENYTTWNQSLIQTILKTYPLRNFYTSLSIVYYTDTDAIKKEIIQYDYVAIIETNNNDDDDDDDDDNSTKTIIIIIVVICIVALGVVIGIYIYSKKKKQHGGEVYKDANNNAIPKEQQQQQNPK